MTVPLPVTANSAYPPDIANGVLRAAYKAPARVATAAALPAYTRTGNVILANSVASINTAGIDGKTDLALGDRVLVKDGAAGADNGIYDVTALGATSTAKWQLTRSGDCGDDSQIQSGVECFVSEGSANAGVTFALTTANPLTLNTTSLTFSAAASTTNATTVGGQLPSFHSVRGVVTSNIASLAAFTVAGNDGLTYTAGQRVLLAGQTTPAENGIYVVGTVGGGTAPLTRAADWVLASVQPAGAEINVNEGTAWSSSKWFATAAGAVTVGVTAPAFYPRRQVIVTSAMSGTPGTTAVSTAWVLHATKSSVSLTVKTPGTQGFLSVGTLTAGAGTGSFTVTSTANETSTLYVTIEN